MTTKDFIAKYLGSSIDCDSKEIISEFADAESDI